MKRILVIGCGSIGQRHIRNLLCLKKAKILAFDVDWNKLKQLKRTFSGVTTSSDLRPLWRENPEIAFITNPTSLHLKYAYEAAKRNCHLFIEKPLSHDLKNVTSLLNIVKQKKLITLVGCNMRFYWAISKIKKLLEKGTVGRVLSARIECGQYLPDWHPWEDYRKMYSARKELGGGVILDAIHEVDYACWFFGQVTSAIGMQGKISSLKIDTEDIAELLFKFKSGPLVNIHMDYLQRIFSRSCKIIGERGTIEWRHDTASVKLSFPDKKKSKLFKQPKGYETNQMYVDSTKYFLTCVNKRKKTFNDVFRGAKTLEIILKAKQKGVGF